MSSTLAQKVDEAIALEQQMKKCKKRMDSIKAELTTAAYAEMDNKNLSFFQITGTSGRFNVVYKEKFEVDNYDNLIDVLGEVALSKVSRKQAVKYETDLRFKAALIALYKAEYTTGVTIESILSGLGLGEDVIKALKKKLKGEYLKDKQLLESVGVTGELEEELDAIRMVKNGELVERFFGQLSKEQIDIIRNAVYVEDSISVGLEINKDT
ncbi:ABC transporter permease [Paenibacillus melissococcoides]|uniref:ABC transporter permease n=1 Tax=Paenibacillus melissococcoides TaxID=2912268 RepID=A0ABN8U8F5_9BACL|nr:MULTISPECIES: ABC transporter permease [Paenibacillus]MEB9897179.1 ABC transporter permease [Bacillus cereus]CAH8245695.1 ABC transporter permease [Paenibacillus melissococcoides]CAH8711710.1 ABC transporter permease [Paenibacillus melissococcoides]CAH8712476.1 ABC transporter permease [Paenibacillus melissococcoides]CAH8719608.1 ABC transporter permease [Paenibacillus melissococcoides]